MSILDHLPTVLFAVGPRGLAWWQWAALPIVAVVSWVVGVVLGRLTRAVLHLVARRTTIAWDDQLVDGAGAPLTLAWGAGVARTLLPSLHLVARVEGSLARTLGTGVLLAFFWLLLRVVTVLGGIIATSTWAQARPATRSLVPLGARILQVGVLAMAIVAVLADFGFPVASLVAGLGIGGLALALAGQKTVENLFGAFSIGVDQPFRPGDFIAVDGIQGNVETIGLRSTRIRTLERTLVTIPNGKLADMRIECFAPRDRIRLVANLGLEYGATAAQVREVIAGVERLLREHPRIHPEGIAVGLRELGAESMIVEVAAWFQTSDYNLFRELRQQTLLACLEVVERAGARLALPSRTVHLRREAAPASDRI